ncbi:MAG TPA: S1C family serine protease [Acidimicrobiales bacterium]|nr:S1C family serine protease [Acidimicrobiales bacterium]
MDLGDFEGVGDEEEGGHPLLPPDDRVWRHPSELSRLGGWAPTTVSRHHERRSSGRLLGGVVAGAALTTVAFAGLHGSSAPAPTASPAPHRAQLTGAGRPVTMGQGLSAGVARTEASLVRIEVSRAGRTYDGAALVVRPDGSLVTTAALVDGASAVWVVDSAGSRWVATVVGTDDVSDVAVLRAPLAGLHPVAGATTAAVTQGSMVLALVPSGQRRWAPTLSFGTVLAPVMNEATPGPAPTAGAAEAATAASVLDAIATDLPATSGDEGSPILDGTGGLVGLLAQDGTGPTPALIVRMSVASDAAEQLITSGQVTHGWLGVNGTAPAPGGGLLVSAVAAGSPAAAAGLTVGEAIVAADGHPVASMADLWGSIKLKRPGQVVTLKVTNGTQTWSKQVVLASPPSS